MNIFRLIAGAVTSFALIVVVGLYGAHAARGPDHQDSPTVVARPGADITDVFVYPAPDNANNVVLAMNVYPLIPGGMSTNAMYAFDPSVLYQFKVANNIANSDYAEKQVIQFTVSGSSQTGQTLTMYGPGAPAQVGTSNTLIASTGTVPFNTATTLDAGKVQVFAGTRRDPFFFDLAQFFKIVPDRDAAYHAAGQTVPAATAASFNGFAANAHGCLTAASSNFLQDYNVLSIVVELPKSMLAPAGGTLGKIGVWATTSTVSGS